MDSLMLYVYTVASIGLVWVASKLWKHLVVVKRIEKALAQLPSAKMHWFFGHAFFYSLRGEENLKSVRECMAQRPRIEAFWLGNWMVGAVRVWHPDTVKAILKTSEPKYITRLAKGWMGDCLKLTSGSKWNRNRGLVTTSFHKGPMKGYALVKNEKAKVLRDKLLRHAERGESVEMFQAFTLMSLEIIFQIFASININLQSLKEEEPYMNAISELLELWNKRIAQPWLHSDWIYSLTRDGRKWANNVKLVHQFSEAVISQKRESLVKTEKPTNLLDALMKAKDAEGNELSDTEIRDEVTLLLFAGHGTAPKTLSWLACTLAAHPEAQQKCQDEIDQYFEGKEDDVIIDEDLESFPYLTMCINESMRLHTTVPIIARELSKPLTLDGVELPVNTVVFVHLYGLHHNPQVWSEPMKFKPERFIAEAVEQRDSHSFLPFSSGPRNCVAKTFAMNELKIIMATLLRKLTFTVDVDQLPIHQPSILMKSENGFHLKITKRF